MEGLYTYRITVLKVVDGDTVHAEVDLGFDVKLNTSFRLAGINAPEMKTPEGQPAKEFLASLLQNTPIIAKTDKDHREKYGRYLVTLFDKDGKNLNEAMLVAGHAVVY